MLSAKIYQKNLVAFIIDEAHCIKKWYVASHELGWVAVGQCYSGCLTHIKHCHLTSVCMHYVGVTVSGWSSLILEKSGALLQRCSQDIVIEGAFRVAGGATMI